MRWHLLIKAALVATLAGLCWIAVPAVQAADQPAKEKKTEGKAKGKKSSPPASSEAREHTLGSGAASEAQKDCLARIPQDATEGQRMMAEASCKRGH